MDQISFVNFYFANSIRKVEKNMRIESGFSLYSW